MGSDQAAGQDFFVSYTQADRAWAEWIAWVLEEDGHAVLIQAWDFVPGSNWTNYVLTIAAAISGFVMQQHFRAQILTATAG